LGKKGKFRPLREGSGRPEVEKWQGNLNTIHELLTEYRPRCKVLGAHAKALRLRQYLQKLR
jgi:hypothetical protein